MGPSGFRNSQTTGIFLLLSGMTQDLETQRHTHEERIVKERESKRELEPTMMCTYSEPSDIKIFQGIVGAQNRGDWRIPKSVLKYLKSYYVEEKGACFKTSEN